MCPLEESQEEGHCSKDSWFRRLKGSVVYFRFAHLGSTHGLGIRIMDHGFGTI